MAILRRRIVTTLEESISTRKTGKQTIGELIDATIARMVANEERLLDVCLEFTEEDWEYMTDTTDAYGIGDVLPNNRRGSSE